MLEIKFIDCHILYSSENFYPKEHLPSNRLVNGERVYKIEVYKDGERQKFNFVFYFSIKEKAKELAKKHLIKFFLPLNVAIVSRISFEKMQENSNKIIKQINLSYYEDLSDIIDRL